MRENSKIYKESIDIMVYKIHKQTSIITDIVFIALLVLLFIIFCQNLVPEGLLPIIQFSDEFLMLFSILIIAIHFIAKMIKMKISTFDIWILFYLAYQIINYIQSPFTQNILLSITQSLISIKIFLIMIALFYTFKPSKINIKIIKIIFFTVLIVGWGSLLLNILIGELWFSILNREYLISYRLEFIRPIGSLGNAAQYGYFTPITLLTVCAIYIKKHKLKYFFSSLNFTIYNIIIVLSIFMLTVRKTVFIFIPLYFYMFKSLKNINKIFIFYMLLAILALIFFLFNDSFLIQATVQNFKDMITNQNNSYSRGLMIYNGFKLSIYQFPFGSGGGTFGTVLSIFNSAAYEYLNFPPHMYASENYGKFGLYDSGLFSFIGENGFIGFTMLIVMITLIFRQFKYIYTINYFFVISKILLIFMIILTFTEPIFENGLFISYFIISLLFIYIKMLENIGGTDEDSHSIKYVS